MLLFTMFSLSVLVEVHIFQCRNSFYFCNEELPQGRFILDLWGNVIPVYQTTICFQLLNFYTATLISNGTLSKNIFFLCILVDHDICFMFLDVIFFREKLLQSSFPFHDGVHVGNGLNQETKVLA